MNYVKSHLDYYYINLTRNLDSIEIFVYDNFFFFMIRYNIIKKIKCIFRIEIEIIEIEKI